jgi:hypothetical protein
MPEKDARRLDSWKEIADYLRREVRTVQRWEKEKGLPVNRVPGGTRHAVFAYAGEIDTWLGGQATPLEESNNHLQSILSVAPVWGVVLVFALGFVALGFWRTNRPGPVGRVSFSGNALVAWDAEGRTVWKYPFPATLKNLTAFETERIARIADLDGDGRREVLVVPSFELGSPQGAGSETIYCLSHDGKLLWTYQPTLALQFERRYAGPWEYSDLVIAPGARGKSIWAAFVHQTWSPSILVRLDPHGQPALKFVNAGWITKLAYLTHASDSYILAGGINNEYDAGFLAVLKAEQPPATFPPLTPGTPPCAGCPDGRPLRYFLFPRSELNRVEHAPANLVRVIHVSSGGVEVRTEEVPESPTSPNVYGIYELSENLGIKNVSVTSAYWDLHRKLEDEGRITHSVARCRERTAPPKVRIWDRERGWHEAGPSVLRARK